MVFRRTETTNLAWDEQLGVVTPLQQHFDRFLEKFLCFSFFSAQGQEFKRCEKRKIEDGRRLHKSECPAPKISPITPSSQHLTENYCTDFGGNKEFRQ